MQNKWQGFLRATGILLSVGIALSGVARAGDHGRHDRDDRDDQGRHYYSDHDRDSMREWYHDHDRDGHLPPGLAKRDQLPPGLERQLRVRGTLPPGLRKRMAPCPEEIERRLPPPPPDCAHVVIGGHVVLVNRRSYVVLDIFHFEL
jgi:Ni/Co efflux regulator RcnB